MARTTMSYLITRVRQLLNDTDKVLFPSDDEIEIVLDEGSYRIRRHQLRVDATRTIYTAEVRDLEGVVNAAAGGWTGTTDSTILAIYNSKSTAATAVTPDAWDLRRGQFEFTSEQTDLYYFLDAEIFDPYPAAAKLCEQLTLKSSITPGAGETGGAIVGRFDYERAARRFRMYSKPRRIELHRVRSKRRAV